MLSKLPPKGEIDIEYFPPEYFVITIRRGDRELSISLTREEFKNLVEYMENLLKI